MNPIVVFFVQDWRTGSCYISVLHVDPQLSVPCEWVPKEWRTKSTVIFLFPFSSFIPESPRWLLVQNRQKEAMSIISKISRMNGNTLPGNITATAKVAVHQI